ncbi:MAG: P-loop NTPase [Kofleriaceae bacterium]|nr:P-loop NTPase [Kofleriaceae bacterium]
MGHDRPARPRGSGGGHRRAPARPRRRHRGGRGGGGVTDQAASLRAAGAGVSPLLRPRRRVVAVTGGKGGVGKSTIAVNLAAAWARRGARVCAVDGDAGMADLNLLLGVAPSHSLADLLAGVPIEEILVAAHGVHLLPALNGSFALANLDDLARSRLWAALGTLAPRFDSLVIDTAAGIGAGTMGLAGAAADIVVVARAEPLSLADAYACIKVLAQRERVRQVFVLANDVRSPSDADEVYGRLRVLVARFLGIDLVALPPVPRDPAIADAAAAGEPVVTQRPDSPAARAIHAVARALDALAAPAVAVGPLAGFVRGDES